MKIFIYITTSVAAILLVITLMELISLLSVYRAYINTVFTSEAQREIVKNTLRKKMKIIAACFFSSVIFHSIAVLCA